MKFPWKIVRTSTYLPADRKLHQIKEILFPKLVTRIDFNPNGEQVKYVVDCSVDSNLDNALIELQEGNNDSLTHERINFAIKKLNKLRKLLNVSVSYDNDVKYIVIANELDHDNPENIIPKAEIDNNYE